MRAKILLTALAAFGASLFLAGGFAQTQAEDDIVVGFAVAQSGIIQPYDSDGIKMAQLWVDQTNEKGGLLGKKLKAVISDTKSDRSEGVKAGQVVLHEGAAIVIVSCDYDFGAPAALQAQRAGVISVSICAG